MTKGEATARSAMKLALESLSPWAGEDANHTEQYAAYQALRQAFANEALDRMAENAIELGLDYGAKSDHRMMENAKGELERIKLVQTGVGIGKPEQETEFFTHNVEQPYDWSEWVCPDPKGYLMKCCDCGLVHEAEFGVVRYKSETEREDCDIVDDANLQAVFRMRRSEQWLPVDTAHRAGGLPMDQSAQQEPVAVVSGYYGGQCVILPIDPARIFNSNTPLYTSPPAQRTWVGLTAVDRKEIERQSVYVEGAIRLTEANLKEKNA